MKVIKKILKIAALIGALAGIVQLIIRALKLSEKVAATSEKAVFGGKKIVYEKEPFEQESISSIFSGTSLDFKKATMLNAESTLDILGRFSGIDVKVPDSWHVKMAGTLVKSGIGERYKDNSEDENAPVLNINYDLKYCGLNVANPKVEELVEEEFEETNEDNTEAVIDETENEENTFEMSEETKKVIEDFEETFDKETPHLEENEIIEEVIEDQDTF